MKYTKRVIATVAVMASLGLLTTACEGDGGDPSSNKAQSTQNSISGGIADKFSKAVPYPFLHSMPSDPLEEKNLARRLLQYNSKGNTNYVYVFAGMTDTVIGYYVIRGKVSSTSSQMTAPQMNVKCGTTNSNNDPIMCTDEAPGDDGSYGPEEGGSSGVFFFTVEGALVETDQPWIVSSQPMDIFPNARKLNPVVKK